LFYLSFNKAKAKGKFVVFILGETKKEQTSKERSFCFFEAKGKRFFFISSHSKKGQKTKFLFLFTKCTA
jgi:hypothetical protein